MKEASLIILAAGLGSRYGGLKQADQFLPGQKTIMEYSIYDAFLSGFRHFIIVVKKENYELIKNKIDQAFDFPLDIDYVIQDQPIDRKKPLGTAHALLCCKDKVKEAIGIINGDDFYGRESFYKLYEALNTKVDEQTSVLISYLLENTLSKNGGVSRGICKCEGNHLVEIHECTNILYTDQLTCDQNIPLLLSQQVSMNMWGFSKAVFQPLEKLYQRFLNEILPNYFEKAEFYLPDLFDYLIQLGRKIEVIPSLSRWYGVTYQEDKEEVYQGVLNQLPMYTFDLKIWDNENEKIKTLLEQFQIEGNFLQFKMNTQGNINSTYQIKTTSKNYILQRINTAIFKDVKGLMNNIALVTNYLKQKGKMTLILIPSKDNQYTVELNGQHYRMYDYIENSFSYKTLDSASKFYETGLCFGMFFKDLNAFDTTQLTETIPDFHNTIKRYEQFEEALSKASLQRKQSASQEINYLQAHRSTTSLLENLYKEGKILKRVCHNDTKLSNILFDQTSKKPLCVIDFDTIQPGYIAHDYGDALRSGANTTYEDDSNLENVHFDLDYAKNFTQGFLKPLQEDLLESEKQSLWMGVEVIVFEQALRFLTDYLNGDTYYKIDYPTHNLVRAKNQIQLFKDIKEKESQIQQFFL